MGKVEGYAAVFYDPDTPGTEFKYWEDAVERIMPGAFDKALKRDNVVALLNHNPDNILGRTSAGTLRLKVDKRGLHYSVPPADTQLWRDVYELQQRGDLLGSSFGFVIKDEHVEKRDGVVVREIRDVELIDVGPVTFPAYEATEGRQLRYVGADGLYKRPSDNGSRALLEVRARLHRRVSRSQAVLERLERLALDDSNYEGEHDGE